MPSLFMILIGCKPQGRFTEQHDIFFGIAETVGELKAALIESWPEAKGKMHVDGWREVKRVGDYTINIVPKNEAKEQATKLFFINLGGYKRNEFDEFHYKMLIAAADSGEAIRIAKQSAFYKHTQFEGASSHVDDKYGVDVDDIYEISEILSSQFKDQYSIQLSHTVDTAEDEIHLGYFKLDKL